MRVAACQIGRLPSCPPPRLRFCSLLAPDSRTHRPNSLSTSPSAWRAGPVATSTLLRRLRSYTRSSKPPVLPRYPSSPHVRGVPANMASDLLPSASTSALSLGLGALCVVRWLSDRQCYDVHRLPSAPLALAHWLWGHEILTFQGEATETYSKWAALAGPFFRVKGALFHPDIIVAADHGAVQHIFQNCGTPVPLRPLPSARVPRPRSAAVMSLRYRHVHVQLQACRCASSPQERRRGTEARSVSVAPHVSSWKTYPRRRREIRFPVPLPVARPHLAGTQKPSWGIASPHRLCRDYHEACKPCFHAVP
ncbi:hypothetical protein BD309DRAFT_598575 [Dichomitus squalens]|nr:hypothetical protein BD309DRAFT_598575 [Dichomitus squalens]